jgi:N-acetylmuramoyl-L-alanine amidase
MKKVVISSAHGKYVAGARGLIDEVAESRRVVTALAGYLRMAGLETSTWHDDVSTTQAGNLNAIVAYHNAQRRDLDVSVHFNAHKKTDLPRGVEVLYRTQQRLATDVSRAISVASGLINRGAKKRTNLAFLNRTTKPAILIEVCFVDSRADVELYRSHFELICKAAAEAISGKPITTGPAKPET